MFNIINDKEEKKTKKKPSAIRGVLTLVGVGIGMGSIGYVYGAINGMDYGGRKGYEAGFKNGIVHANNQLLEAAKTIANSSKVTKGD